MSTVLKSWILLVTMGGFLYSRDYINDREIARGEYYVLGMFGVMGMMIMVSAVNMLTVYLGLELLALSLYAMVALYRNNSNASEAAMKYFVLGALASGMLLYGMSMIYGATGSLDLDSYSLDSGWWRLSKHRCTLWPDLCHCGYCVQTRGRAVSYVGA